MAVTIRIGTSGWVYKHWVGRFYPPDLPQRDWLRFYAARFATVEINRSFYRLPDRDQFRIWAEQTATRPDFCFAVKASRFLTHMKKLKDPGEPLDRLVAAADGLGDRVGPFLYQLPPRWRADPDRLAHFVAALPAEQRAAFEFRDPSWFRGDIFQILEAGECALAIGVRGREPFPPVVPAVGPFRYVRFHHGARGTGFTDDELAPWIAWIADEAAHDRDVYVYFNNDPGGHALADAERLRAMLREAGAIAD